MTDRMTIPTANLGFSTTPIARGKLTLGDGDNDRQLEMAVWTFWVPILQYLVVDRCRNHLANLLLSSSSSKITNLALEFCRYLSEFQRCNYFWFWRPYRYFRLSVTVVLTCQHYFPPLHGLKLQICGWNFNCTSHSLRCKYFRFRPPFAIIGHYWNRLRTFPASLPWSNAVGSPLEFRLYIVSYGDISTSGNLARYSL